MFMIFMRPKSSTRGGPYRPYPIHFGEIRKNWKLFMSGHHHPRAHFALNPITTCLMAACFLSHPLAHAADEAALGTVVVSGSRTPTDSYELPYSVDAVTGEDITQGQLGVNASESLMSVPGLVVQNRQNYAQDLQISVRGFGARAAFGVRGVKLIADGIPATNPDGQGQVATFNLDVADRIEVLRGPFSTIYGNHAGGVIQLFTRDPAPTPQISGRVIGGSFDTFKFGIGAEGTKNDVGYLLDLSHFETDGFRDHSDAVRDQAFAKLLFKPDEDSKLTIVASSLNQDDTKDPKGVSWDTFKTDPKAVEQIALDYDTRKDISHAQAGATYARNVGPHKLEVSAYAGQRHVMQVLSIPWQAQQFNTTSSGGIVDFDRQFAGFGARWTHNIELGDDLLSITAGVDYDWMQDDRQGYENYLGFGTVLGVRGDLRRDERDTLSSIDPYIQANYETGRWTFSGGLRHSRVNFDVEDNFLSNGDDSGDQTYSRTTPTVGVLFRATEDLHLYASAGTGFETPTFGEVSYSSGTGTLNLGLKPSTSEQYELGVKAKLPHQTRLNAAIFQINTENEVVVASSSGGRTVYQNAGKTLRQGLEIALDSQLTKAISARASFTQLRAVYDEGFESNGNTVDEGNRIPGIPATTVYAEVAYAHPVGVKAALEGIYRSKVEVNDMNDDRAAPAYTLVNLRFTAEQKRGPWTLGQMLRLDNLFDREHIGSVVVGDSNGRYYEPGPGFAWYAGVNATYGF